MFRKKKKEKTEKELINDRKEILKALEVLFAADYIDKKKLYFENFLRGMAFSVGGIIGATVLIAVLVGFLSIFDEIPLIGPFIDSTKNSIEQGPGSR